MNNEQRLLFNALIDSRLTIAFERLDANPKYIERCEKQYQSNDAIEKMLEERLGRDERMAFRLHMEGETAKDNLQLNQAYMQGLRDCMKTLRFLGAFSIF